MGGSGGSRRARKLMDGKGRARPSAQAWATQAGSMGFQEALQRNEKGKSRVARQEDALGFSQNLHDALNHELAGRMTPAGTIPAELTTRMSIPVANCASAGQYAGRLEGSRSH